MTLSTGSDVANATVFTAGNGQRFGLVTLPASDQIVVFVWRAEKWVGCCQFGATESQGVWPGEAIPEVVEALTESER